MNYIIANDGNVTATVAGEVYTFGKSHPRYERLVTHLKNNNVEHFEASYDIVSHVYAYCEGYASVENGKMKWDGIDMPEMFGGTILDMIQQGYPFEPMLNFLDNMSQNPSDHAITELFEFMENKNMPITPDGHFLAYKAVDSIASVDYTVEDDQLDKLNLGIQFWNSYDGSRSFGFSLMLYRLICTNGMMSNSIYKTIDLDTILDLRIGTNN